MKCLRSLLEFSAEPISLIVHDDGTLTDEDCEALSTRLGGSTILRRDEADARVSPLLDGHRRCAEYRRLHPLGLKLFDVALLGQDALSYCDSDILFLRPFTNLFCRSSCEAPAIFMQDTQEAYSLYPWHVPPVGKLRLPSKVNSGLIRFSVAAFDLDFIEWLLGRAELAQAFSKRPHWIEQTCWAALGWRVGCHLWSRRQLVLANERMTGVSGETVGIHFVAAYRGHLDKYPLSAGRESPPLGAVRVRTSPARPTSSLDLLRCDVRRRL